MIEKCLKTLAILFCVGLACVVFGQEKLTTAQQLQAAKNKIVRQGIIIVDIKADRNQAIGNNALLQNNINQLNAKLIQTKQILQESIKNEKIDIKALNLLGFGLSNKAELPASLPDTSKDSR